MRLRHRSLLDLKYPLFTVLFVAVTGCQSVDTQVAHLFGEVPDSELAQQTGAETPDGPTFQVEIREDGRQPQLTSLPLPDSMYVQQVLDQSGALRRFRRVRVEIYRQLPEGGGHRLDVVFDKTTHRIPPSSDYSIHPDDRVVITEDRSTILDDMLESIGGPLSRLNG